MRELPARLGDADVVISDASFSAGWIGTHIPARAAGRHFLFARGQGGLGYAVPAAIGAALARPAGRVVTVSGDGGVSYAIGGPGTPGEQGPPPGNRVPHHRTPGWAPLWG